MSNIKKHQLILVFFSNKNFFNAHNKVKFIFVEKAMKKNSYSFKLKKIVNNLKGFKLVSNQIENLRHTISNTNFKKLCSNFYAQNCSFLVTEAELNINTIFDLDNYLSWLELYGEF